MPKIVVILIIVGILSFSSILTSADYLFVEQEDREEADFRKKSAAKAIILSTLIPGAGQYYVRGFNLQSLIFFAVESGLWTGYIVYDSKGRNMERNYERYADKYYNREYQLTVQENLIGVSTGSIYTEEFFRLDEDNTQHYYEDIGKYNKYIFGWEDWYDTYFRNGVQWVFEGEGHEQIWVGNYPSGSDPATDEWNIPFSALRQKYIKMRQDAEDYYSVRNNLSFGFALNRIASTILTIRQLKRHNQKAASFNYSIKLNPRYQAPMINLSLNF